MGFVNDRFVPGDSGRFIVAPIEAALHDHANGSKGGTVAFIEREVLGLVPYNVAKQRIIPSELAADGPGIWVEQEFVRVEAESFFRFIRAVDTVSIKLARSHLRQVDMPNAVGPLPNP